MRTAWLILWLVSGWAMASTIEVVRLYQPLSLHGTDGSGEEDPAGEPLQAAVLARPFALTGAIPEDLAKAVAAPCEIDSNNPAYEVSEANLLPLCRIAMDVRFDEEDTLRVTFDLADMEIPEEVDLVARQILRMGIQAVRRTLEHYYSHDEASLRWKVVIAGTKESNASLKDLGKVFTLGKAPDQAAAGADDGK